MFDRKLASGYADINKLYAYEFKGYLSFFKKYVKHLDTIVDYEQEFTYLVPSLDELLLLQPAISAKAILDKRMDLTVI